MPGPPLELFAGVVPFVAIADAKSFRGAARDLGVTTSSVSKAISRLEADLGVRLLHRTSRRVTITEEGERFLDTCREAVDQVRSARETLAQVGQQAPRGVVRVSLPPTLAHAIVGALPRLLAQHPLLSVHVMVTARFVQLTEENIDIAVRVGALPDSSCSSRRLRALRLVTAASPAYLQRCGTPRTPGDLAQHNCLKFVLQTGVPQKWIFREDEEIRTVRVGGNLASDEGDSLIAAAVAGLGIMQAPDVMIAAQIASGDLVPVLQSHAAPAPPLTVLCAPGRKDLPKVRAFVAFVTELCASAPSGRDAAGKAVSRRASRSSARSRTR